MANNRIYAKLHRTQFESEVIAVPRECRSATMPESRIDTLCHAH
jgi:hypothetical protein